MKVFVATPAYRGIDCDPYLDSLEATLALFAENKINLSYNVLTGCCYVQIARNDFVHQFLNSDCDKLLFLDDDISWNPEDALKLVLSEKNFVCGVYPLKNEVETFTVVLEHDEGHVRFDNQYLLGTRVPTGFLCIDRGVFEQIKEENQHLAYIDNNEWKFDFFPQGVNNHVWVGEDFAFCDLWTKGERQIHILPDMTLTHHGDGKKYTGNLWKYLTELPGGSNEKTA